MDMKVTNHTLQVGCIELTGVASASLLQVGDTDNITLYSFFDTPPESLIIGPFVELPPPSPPSSLPSTEPGVESVESGSADIIEDHDSGPVTIVL